MNYVKEPVGVDFSIKSAPLTNEGRQEISAFIKAIKAEQKKAHCLKEPKPPKYNPK
jgi:hypothetical protein